MRSLGFSFRSWPLPAPGAVAVLVAIFALGCGGDDTEVAPLIDSGGADRLSDTSQDGKGPDGSSGRAGSGGQGGAAGAGGLGGKGGAGAAGASGAGGTAGTGGSAGTAGASGAGGGGSPDGGGRGGTDAGADGSDDGPPLNDGATDAGPPLTIADFQHAIAVAWCDRVFECCQFDSAHFNRTKCIDAVDNGNGPEGVATYLKQYKADAGPIPSTLRFDTVQAAQCVALERNRACTGADGAEKRNIYVTCVTALQGSQTEGNTCRTSAECTGGRYCGFPLGVDAGGDASSGTTTCLPISGSGGLCDDPNRNSDRCNYLGVHSATSQHCDPWGGTGTCVEGLPLASSCRGDQECASELCSSTTGTCVTSQQYPSAFTCTTYRIVDDAGGDGG